MNILTVNDLFKSDEPHFAASSFTELAKERSRAAKQTLFSSYMRHVLKIAKTMMGQGLDFDDLVQEGFMGLLKAVEKFSFRDHTSFAAYCTSWIWQRMSRALVDQGKSIRLPVHMHEKIGKVKKACAAVALGEDGSELAVIQILMQENSLLDATEYGDCTHSRASSATLKEKYRAARDLLQKAIACEHVMISLGASIPTEYLNIERDLAVENTYLGAAIVSTTDLHDNLLLGELLPSDEHAAQTDCEREQDLEIISTILARFTPREELVVRLRYGLKSNSEETLEKIGRRLQLSKERVRQIEKQAMKRLRHHAHKKKLDGLLEKTSDHKHWLSSRLITYLNNCHNFWLAIPENAHGSNQELIDYVLSMIPDGRRERGFSPRTNRVTDCFRHQSVVPDEG